MRYQPGSTEWDEDRADAVDLIMYQIEGDTIVNPYNYNVDYDLEPYQQDTELHQRIWDMFVLFIPPEYHQYYTRFTIITDGPGNILAATRQTSSRPETWTLRIDIMDANDDENLANSLIHEFSHLLTLNGTQVNQDPGQSCSAYGTEYLCSLPDSYLNLFFEEFWAEIYPEWEEVDALQGSPDYIVRMWEFYDTYEDYFIDPYASTSPEEDIVETLTYFFFMPRPPDRDIANAKVLYFYDYPELVDLREQIQQQVCLHFAPEVP
jgi:hypothetical protein